MDHHMNHQSVMHCEVAGYDWLGSVVVARRTDYTSCNTLSEIKNRRVDELTKTGRCIVAYLLGTPPPPVRPRTDDQQGVSSVVHTSLSV